MWFGALRGRKIPSAAFASRQKMPISGGRGTMKGLNVFNNDER
jgi:hypothetical protein